VAGTTIEAHRTERRNQRADPGQPQPRLSSSYPATRSQGAVSRSPSIRIKPPDSSAATSARTSRSARPTASARSSINCPPPRCRQRKNSRRAGVNANNTASGGYLGDRPRFSPVRGVPIRLTVGAPVRILAVGTPTSLQGAARYAWRCAPASAGQVPLRRGRRTRNRSSPCA
jgi:hypothetical protein